MDAIGIAMRGVNTLPRQRRTLNFGKTNSPQTQGETKEQSNRCEIRDGAFWSCGLARWAPAKTLRESCANSLARIDSEAQSKLELFKAHEARRIEGSRAKVEAKCAEPSNEVVCSSKQLDVGIIYRFAIGEVCRLGGTSLSNRRAPIGGGGALRGEASPARFRCDEATAGPPEVGPPTGGRGPARILRLRQDPRLSTRGPLGPQAVAGGSLDFLCGRQRAHRREVATLSPGSALQLDLQAVDECPLGATMSNSWPASGMSRSMLKS